MGNQLFRLWLLITGKKVMHSCGKWTRRIGDKHDCPQEPMIRVLNSAVALLKCLPDDARVNPSAIRTLEGMIDQIKKGYSER